MNYEMEAIHEFASIAGAECLDAQWIAHPAFADVYVENPHYIGPDQPHPMSDCEY